VLGALCFHHGDNGALDGGLGQLAGRLKPSTGIGRSRWRWEFAVEVGWLARC
jgi:hypothetical protein